MTCEVITHLRPHILGMMTKGQMRWNESECMTIDIQDMKSLIKLKSCGIVQGLPKVFDDLTRSTIFF